MKLRDLKHWPPTWVGLSQRTEAHAVAEEGLLEGVERFGNRLLLRINVNGLRRTASIEWEPPPSVREIEAVLLASIGSAVRDLADREVPSGTGSPLGIGRNSGPEQPRPSS